MRQLRDRVCLFVSAGAIGVDKFAPCRYVGDVSLKVLVSAAVSVVAVVVRCLSVAMVPTIRVGSAQAAVE